MNKKIIICIFMFLFLCNIAFARRVIIIPIDIGGGNGSGSGNGTINNYYNYSYDNWFNISEGIYYDGGGILDNSTIGGTPLSGGGTRFMWIPSKNSFRFGTVTGNQWDDFNIGTYSLAGLYNSVASGTGSISLGVNCNASNSYSQCYGVNSLSSGVNSYAEGTSVKSSGDYSTCTGSGTECDGESSTGSGLNTKSQAFATFTSGSNTVASKNFDTSMGNNLNVSGVNSFGIGLNNSYKVFSLNNTFGVIGGDAYISGKLNVSGNIYENNSRVCTPNNGLCSNSTSSIPNVVYWKDAVYNFVPPNSDDKIYYFAPMINTGLFGISDYPYYTWRKNPDTYEKLPFQIQIPHDYIINTSFSFSIHFTNVNTPISNDKAVFIIDYSLAGSIPNCDSTKYDFKNEQLKIESCTLSTYDYAWTHYETPMQRSDVSNFVFASSSGIITGMVYRLYDDRDDTLNDDIVPLSIDVHYQSNKAGTNTERI